MTDRGRRPLLERCPACFGGGGVATQSPEGYSAACRRCDGTGQRSHPADLVDPRGFRFEDGFKPRLRQTA